MARRGVDSWLVECRLRMSVCLLLVDCLTKMLHHNSCVHVVRLTDVGGRGGVSLSLIRGITNYRNREYG